MTETTHLATLPNREQLQVVPDRDIELERAQDEALAAYQEVKLGRSTNPESHIDLYEEDTAGPLWQQHEAEARVAAEQVRHEQLSHEQQLEASIEQLSAAEQIADISGAGKRIMDLRITKAA